MAGRVKFEVWSEKKGHWRTAYVKAELAEQRVKEAVDMDLTVRLRNVVYGQDKRKMLAA
jgi:hypothetical protein